MLEIKSSQVVNLAEAHLLCLSRKQAEFLKLFLNLGERYKSKLFFCHRRLAEISGCSVSTTRRMLNYLEERGLLEIEHRNYQSNLYHLNPIVFTPVFKQMMRKIFVAFSLFFPLYFLSSKPLQQKNEQLLNINGSYLLTSELLARAYHYKIDAIDHYEAYAQARGEFPRMPAKFRSSEAMYNPIRQTIIDLKTIKLTQWGQIELEAYPDTAIEYAENRMRSAKNVRDRFKLFVSFCNEYCRQAQIAPSWRKTMFLRESYPRPVDAVMYIEDKKESPQMGSSTAKRQSWRPSEGPSDLAIQIRADLDRKWKEYELSKGVLTHEDSLKRYVLPNLHFMPSAVVAELVAAGKLPNCPETQKRIAEGTASALAGLSPDDQIPTKPKVTDWNSMIGPELEDHTTLGIFSDQGETDTQLPW